MYEKHTRRQVFGLFVLLGSVTLVACWKQSQPQHMSDQATSAANDPASDQKEALSWDAFVGVRLRSVQKHLGGLGPDGPTLGHQYLRLNEDGSFEWQQTDITDSGTYRREGKRVLARLRGQDYTGELDLDRGVLTWSGIEFELP